MNFTEEEVERIAQAVAQRLGVGFSENGKAAVASLRITDPVVSTTQLEGRLAGIKNIEVSTGCVVTPAARDLLKEKQIGLSVASRSTSTETKIMLGVAETDYDASPLANQLSQLGLHVNHMPALPLAAAAKEMTAAVVRGEAFGCLVTDQPFAAACLANRHVGVNAAHVRNVAEAQAARDQAAAKLLIVSPSGMDLGKLRDVILAFVHASTNSTAPYPVRTS